MEYTSKDTLILAEALDELKEKNDKLRLGPEPSMDLLKQGDRKRSQRIIPALPQKKM